MLFKNTMIANAPAIMNSHEKSIIPTEMIADFWVSCENAVSMGFSGKKNREANDRSRYRRPIKQAASIGMGINAHNNATPTKPTEDKASTRMNRISHRPSIENSKRPATK
jgi:hypothetical protein